jgi:hypothetical protein
LSTIAASEGHAVVQMSAQPAAFLLATDHDARAGGAHLVRLPLEGDEDRGVPSQIAQQGQISGGEPASWRGQHSEVAELLPSVHERGAHHAPRWA